jgi:hypothetical protein
MKMTFIPPTVASVGSEAELSAWLASAEPGATVQYHDGLLAADVARDQQDKKANAELVAVARLAWWAGQQGLVHLVQRRLAPGRCAYLAIMRPAPARPRDGSHRRKDAAANANVADGKQAHGSVLAELLDHAGEIERLPVDVLVAGPGENRLLLRQRAGRLREHLADIIARVQA